MFLTLQKILLTQRCLLVLLLAVCPLPVLAQAITQPVAQAFTENTVDADLRITANVNVVMRDGVEISVDIYRPALPGQYPTLYAAGPYPHQDDASAPDTPETGPVAWLVSQGYNYVLASVRGTGTSTGEFGLLSAEEQQDHYEIIEWIAAQDWSNGQVAGIGAGYYGTAQWHMAIQNPPHLSCIAPFDGISDPYRDWAWPGGLANGEFLTWYEQQVRDRHAYPARGEPRLLELDLRLEQLRHSHLDAYWLSRSAAAHFDQIRIPVFMLGSWAPGQPRDTQILRTYRQLPASTRFLIGTSADQLQNRALLESELLPYYNWCFSGQDSSRNASGQALKPTFRVAVQNQEQVRDLSDWPAASIRFTSLFLDGGDSGDTQQGTLALSQPQGGSVATEYGEGTTLTALTFRSPLLTQDIELVGPLLLELYASSTGTETAFSVELLEEVNERQLPREPVRMPTFLNPDSSPTLQALTATTDVLVSAGQLKASARTLASSLGTDFQADYAFTGTDNISAGRVYRYDLALQPVARRFRAGNRLVLRIAQTADASLRGQSRKEEPRKDSLMHTEQYASRLMLPLLPDPLLPLSEPFSPFAPLASTESPAAETGNPASFPAAPNASSEAKEGEEEEVDAAKLSADLFDSSNPIILLPRR